ncbi:hypothetical protein EG328_001340 [Venturia inaequalis]|uniref:Armadillo-like helical domain-containing protein n=1 Tax=Venturia inaequalis TaxID=5025 RepID=A0A8H3V0B1_VENIN|nr:hypothetical protein EG328_001340 [Venturia inaequalis]
MSTIPTPKLGGKTIGATGYGLMGLTWRPNPQPLEDSIAVMKSALESGANFWNGGTLYGTKEYNSGQLLNAYFTKYPEDAEKVVISIKGGFDASKHAPDASPAFLRKEVEKLAESAGGKWKIGIFEAARVDPSVPIEETVGELKSLVERGLIGGIGLSECSAETVRRASKVAKIESVEVEFSLFSTDILENGIAKACAELGITIVAYSPLSRGLLTGDITKFDDLPADDMRRHFPRFQPENFEKNMDLVREVQALAKSKGCTSGQIALAWVKAHSGRDGLPIIVPIPGTTTEKRLAENMTEVSLSEGDLKELDEAVKKCSVHGGRYGGPLAALMDGLYESLFDKEEEAIEKSEGFWQELFLLKPDPKALKDILDDLSPDDLLHLQAHPQQLLIRAIRRVQDGKEPSDENALDTLTVFLGAVLNKRYTNPSSDIISVLTGLHDADTVFSDFVGALESAIRNGRNVPLRLKAVKVALAMISGAYSTGLVSYFTHRDLFPALMKAVQDSEDSLQNLSPFILLGLLTNYNKFEFQNPYRLRLDDFVNDGIIRKVVQCVGATCGMARDKYVAIQEDMPEGWNFTNTLVYIGLGALTSSKPAMPTLTPEEAKARFVTLPGPEAAIILSTYDFANANKLFCFNLVTLPSQSKTEPSPISSYLSFTSYLIQHAHRSTRASHYTYISLFTLQILLEDQVLAKRICGEESKAPVRLCRQRQPFLPLVRNDRVLAASILDIAVDGINHNLRKRLDVELYNLFLGILLRVVSFLGRSRTRLAYHWSELWRSLLSFVRFLTTYATDVKATMHASLLVDTLVNLIALSLSTGESFLPDNTAYDDLFYKLVETGDVLIKFRDAYDLSRGPTAGSIDTLISVSRHYHSLLEESKGKGSTNLSPREVHKVIQSGYDTLSIQAKEGLDQWEKFREADHRSILKRMAKMVIDDTKGLLEGI